MLNDDFTFNPPDIEQNISKSQEFFPFDPASAWMLKLIEMNLDNTSLPDAIKKSMAKDMSIYITNAGMTHITQGQVLEFINGFKEVWMRYVIFKVRKKFRPELYYAFGYIREQLILNLNKSVDGWQGDHVYEKRTSYDIRQTKKDLSDKVKGWFFRKKPKQEEPEE
jgi:hypothetical protein